MRNACGLFIVLLFIGASQSFSFDLPPKVEDCFYEDLLKGTDVGFSFQVTAGGALDIDVTTYGPGDEILYGAKRDSNGKYFFVTHLKGPYKFCFSNQMSTVTTKVVDVTLQIGKQRTEEEIVLAILSGREKKNDPGDTHKADDEDTLPLISPLQSSIMQLADGLHSLQGEEKYMRIRERVHRDTAESTNTRIMVSTIIENALLIGVSLFQVYFLKRFFEVKRAV
eukprot:CAMPEP_0117030002 /NCGR_PEP_ID=MMETSP0472-20121206/21671_1 /TAXON_ID=693140 ORGANISM="Tiarina fusus, Strain LIS" /NCGR_SAMPLE_ID=MMETSP0472 /ASSEMBLY_ACC=CAM_ASM_000603 /LENGTH=223 /DNA_ID=CAMNT_0004737913 /DNA_START=20 /DNA_END=691 /DNA_ORIENTATION=-